MGQRGRNAAFMPNKFVFPGGAVEKEDFQINSFKRLNATCNARWAPIKNSIVVMVLSLHCILDSIWFSICLGNYKGGLIRIYFWTVIPIISCVLRAVIQSCF